MLCPLTNKDLHALVNYNIALYLFQKGKNTEATNYIYEAMASSNQWCSPYTLLGQVFETDSLFNQAEAAYLEAINLQPDNVQTIGLLKRLYRKIGCMFEMYNLQQSS